MSDTGTLNLYLYRVDCDYNTRYDINNRQTIPTSSTVQYCTAVLSVPPECI